MERLRVGIIGCGWAGARHAIAIQELSTRIDLAAVCDTHYRKAEDLAKRYNIQHCTADYRDLLHRELLDAVSICLPHDLHAEVAVHAADAGVHVLVEKPLCTTLEDADRMIEAARRNSVLLMVAETVRYHRLYRKVFEILQEGAIGTPFLFRIAREHHMHDYFDNKPWFLEDPSGGIMYSGGIHDFDLLRLIAGEVEHVYALPTIKALQEMCADDTSAAMAKLVSGAAGILVESFSIKTECPGVTGIIHGDKGTLRFSRNERAIWLYTAEEDGHPEQVQQLMVEEQDGFVAEIEDFTNSIQSNTEPLSTAGEGRKSLACVVAAYESMRTGQRVYVDP